MGDFIVFLFHLNLASNKVEWIQASVLCMGRIRFENTFGAIESAINWPGFPWELRECCTLQSSKYFRSNIRDQNHLCNCYVWTFDILWHPLISFDCILVGCKYPPQGMPGMCGSHGDKVGNANTLDGLCLCQLQCHGICMLVGAFWNNCWTFYIYVQLEEKMFQVVVRRWCHVDVVILFLGMQSKYSGISKQRPVTPVTLSITTKVWIFLLSTVPAFPTIARGFPGGLVDSVRSLVWLSTAEHS